MTSGDVDCAHDEHLDADEYLADPHHQLRLQQHVHARERDVQPHLQPAHESGPVLWFARHGDRDVGRVVTDPGLQITADRILSCARNAHPDLWFGTRKVFLAALVDVADPDAMAILDDCRRSGLLRFARADLVAAMDPELIAASEWRLDGASYHFLVVR